MFLTWNDHMKMYLAYKYNVGYVESALRLVECEAQKLSSRQLNRALYYLH